LACSWPSSRKPTSTQPCATRHAARILYIDHISRAQGLSVHASGYMGVVAQDAQFKFLRLGLSYNAYTDPRLQQLATGVLQAQDVVLIISSSGRTPELLKVADAARARGAVVVAVTVGQSPLARRADVVLLADHSEDLETHVPMVSRILMLLFVDILAVGVALRRGHGREDEPVARLQALDLPVGDRTLGVQEATPLAHLSSHARSGGPTARRS
jgi:glucokinase